MNLQTKAKCFVAFSVPLPSSLLKLSIALYSVFEFQPQSSEVLHSSLDIIFVVQDENAIYSERIMKRNRNLNLKP